MIKTEFMGRVKQLMMEMEEHDYTGFSKGEKYVCTHHFDDKYLNQYIQENSEDGICSYCHRKERVIDMSALADHIGMTISIFFNDVDSEGLPLASSYYDDDKEEIPGIKRVGCFAVPEKTEVYEDTSEMMEDLGLHTECEELNEDMEHLFEDNMWVKKDPFELWWNEEMELQWKRFADMVKHSRRFTFLAMPKVNGSENILEELNEVILHTDDVLHQIPIGTTLYRARSLNKALDNSFGFKDITSAPNASAGQCRMSPAGVSMFYGAFDKETAISESIKSADEKVLVIGEFKTIRELTVVDLTALPTDVSIWMDKWEGIAFLKSFHKDITQPLLKDAKEAIEYVPSQIFTEYLRWMFTDKQGRHVDGLMYKSCKTKKANVVLFCNNEESREWVKLDSFSGEK